MSEKKKKNIKPANSAPVCVHPWQVQRDKLPARALLPHVNRMACVPGRCCEVVCDCPGWVGKGTVTLALRSPGSPLWGQPATTSQGRSRSPAERPTGHSAEACCQRPGLPTGPAASQLGSEAPAHSRLGQLTAILSAVLRDRTVQEPLHFWGIICYTATAS